jgi:hypothetical protein
VPPLSTSLIVLALASGAAGGGPVATLLPAAPVEQRPAWLPLRLVPDWRLWVLAAQPRSLPALLAREPGPAPVRRLQLRWVYRRLLELPELDRVGRFARVDFPRTGLSGGPELLRLAPDPPRENYPRAQELTPGWSWWYASAERWAVGAATGTRFLISDHAGTIVDPLTCEARLAFFLP